MSYGVIQPEDIDFSEYEVAHPEHAHVIPASAYVDVVLDHLSGKLGVSGRPLPWSKTQNKISLRPGEVSVWAGINGSGKSLLLNQIILNAIRLGDKACIASMEMKPWRTMERMTRQASMRSHQPESFVRRFHDWLDGKLWLYDQQGTVKSKRILSVMRYCQDGLMHNGEKTKVQHFVIDSLMKCGIAGDDYNTQKDFVDELCAFARDTNIHVHLVAHERKGESSRKMGDKFSIKGASEIADQVDNVFICWRNKDKEEESQLPESQRDQDTMKQPDQMIRCDKQRNGEWEGKIALWFDKDSMQYVGSEKDGPIDFLRTHSEAA
jgi:twinkle protein